jgi:hypothetical protein
LKKLLSILLISAYLISTTEFYQVLKLPLLAEHFNEHKSLNQGTTFWDFLVMHYTNNDVTYADHDKDMRLPFKSHEGSTHSALFTFSNNPQLLTLIKPVVIDLNEYNLLENICFNSEYLSNIWQPPKYS